LVSKIDTYNIHVATKREVLIFMARGRPNEIPLEFLLWNKPRNRLLAGITRGRQIFLNKGIKDGA
jgi:hypothetical protein